MFKKICSLLIVLAITITASSSIIVFAKTDTNNTTENADMLVNFGIINREAGESLKGKITRSEFLKAISVITGVGDEESVLDLFEMDKSMNLSESVSEDFVSEVLVKLLGYGDIAKYTYPGADAYIYQAQKLHLFKGIENTSKLTSGDVYNMIVTALKSEVLAVTGVSVSNNGEKENIMTSYDTALYYYMKIYKVSGVLNATSGASLYDYDEMDKDQLKIGDYIYNDGGKDYDGVIGCYVDAYVKEYKDDNDVVVYMTKESDAELEIMYDDFVDYNALTGELRYYNSNNNVKSTTLSADVIFLYNGTKSQTFNADSFKQKNGKIRLIDNNRDGKYEVACVETYESMVVSSINETTYEVKNMISYKDALKSIILDEENEDYKITIVKDGEKISLKDIPRRASLRVYTNPNNSKPIIKVYVSDKTISGAITRIWSDSENVEIDGTQYTVSETYRHAVDNAETGKADKYLAKLEFGKTYTFYIDDIGEIIAADADVKSSYRYGLMTKAACSNNAFEDEVKIRLFDEGGKLKEYEFAENVEYNKNKKMKAKAVFDSFAPSGKVTMQLVAYKLNKDGKINKFYTAVNQGDATDEDVLVQGNKVNAGYYSTYESEFNSGTDVVFIDESSVIWIAPEDINANSCSVLTRSGLYLSTTYSVTPYNVDEYSLSSLFVVDENSSLKTQRYKSGALFIVTDKGSKATDNGVKNYIEGVSNHFTSMSLTFKDDVKGIDNLTGKSITYDDIKSGDTITLSVDAEGDVREFKRWFSIDQKSETSSFMIENDVWSHARVESIDNLNNIMLVTTGGNKFAIRLNPVCVYYLCEKNGKDASFTARQAAMSDLSEGDYLAIKTDKRNAKVIVIYKGE